MVEITENTKLQLQYQRAKSNRGKVLTEQREMLKTTEVESRELTSEESKHYDALEIQFAELNNECNDFTRNHPEIARKCDTPNKPFIGGENNSMENVKNKGEVRAYMPGTFPKKFEVENKKEADAFNIYLERGLGGLSYEQRQTLEQRALQVDKDTSGGFMVAPEYFSNQIIAGLVNEVFIRKYATILTLDTAQSLGAPELGADPSDPSWTGELSVGDEDTTMKFKKRELFPHPLAKYLKMSRTLIRKNPNAEAFVRGRLISKFATTEEYHFINGTGVDSPLGLMVASASGINTDRDVNTGSSTAILADSLLDCVFSLKPQYRKNGRWIFHRDVVKKIRKLKDGDGDYLWVKGVSDGLPPTIAGYPYDESEYMPNTFSANQYIGLFGDLSYYWIADSLDMTIQVLVELFALSNQNAFVGRRECDGSPVLPEAFARLKLAA